MKISVVIGFRNWGVGRIELASRSILESLAGTGELIVSDYGSDDPEPMRRVADALGAVHVYTDSRGLPWSRSIALNAGFEHSTGDLLVSTDADMLFSPGAFPGIAALAERAGDAALFLQCRDLPTGVNDEWVRENGADWERLERMSRLRPRWGMGGMMAIRRAGFEAIRGFDERFHTYGGDDLDFARRAARAGHRTVWVDDPAVRMYHMWHPSSRTAADASDAGREAVERNRTMLRTDPSYVRNTARWNHPLPDRAPLVSVAIATRDRSALLEQTIRSVLAQSVQDFEIVVVGDGTTDDTAEMLTRFDDDRIRYTRQEAAGISAARNRALDMSRGAWTAVLDDDDLMHPQRLEWQLAAVSGGAAGAVGSLVNVDEQTGRMEIIVSAKPMVQTAAPAGAAPGHGTWLIRTDVMRRLRYDETITSGVDNDLMLRLLRSGVRLEHCGRVVLVRRQHPGQVTVRDSDRQLAAAGRALSFLEFGMTASTHEAHAAALEEIGAYAPGPSRAAQLQHVRAYLPDHLVTRTVAVHGPVDTHDRLRVVEDRLEGRLEGERRLVDGMPVPSRQLLRGASWSDLALLRRAGLDWTVEDVRAADAVGDPALEPDTSAGRDSEIGWILEMLAALPGGPEDWTHAVVGRAAGDATPPGLHRFTRHRGGRRHEVLVQLHEGLDAALAAAATSTSARVVLERPPTPAAQAGGDES